MIKSYWVVVICLGILWVAAWIFCDYRLNRIDAVIRRASATLKECTDMIDQSLTKESIEALKELESQVNKSTDRIQERLDRIEKLIKIAE
jgi:predicted DNA-binding helix-hairpin-helix protein